MQRKFWGIISVDIDAGQPLIMYSAFVMYLRKLEHSETVHQLFIDLKKAYDSCNGEVLYNILIQFGALMKLLRLIKMGLNDTCSRSGYADMFPIRNGLKQGDALSPFFSTFL
jgi:hypothetical protein